MIGRPALPRMARDGWRARRLEELRARRHLALVALTSSYLLACILIAAMSGEAVTYVLVLTQFMVFAAVFVVQIGSDRFDPFELIYPTLFSYFIYFGGKAAYVLVNPFGYSREARIGIVYETIDVALLYVLLGMICLILGYYSAIPRLIVGRLPALRLDAAVAPTVTTIVVIYAIGTGVRLFMYSRGWYMSHDVASFALEQEPYQVTVLYFAYLCTFAYGLAIFNYYRTDRKVFLWLSLLMLPGEALYVFLVGSKFIAVLYLLVMPFGSFYLRGRVPIRSLVVAGAAVVLVVFPVVSAYRGSTLRGDVAWETFGSDVVKVVGFVGEDLMHGDYTALSVDEFMERVAGIDVLTNFLVTVPEYGGFVHGETLMGIVNALIPSPLRPSTGSDLMSRLPALIGFRYGQPGGIGVTQLVEFYWNFGLPGILVGMFFVGILYRVVYLYFLPQREPFNLLLYFLAWWQLVSIDRWFFASIPQMLKMMAIVFVIGFAVNLFSGRRIQA